MLEKIKITNVLLSELIGKMDGRYIWYDPTPPFNAIENYIRYSLIYYFNFNESSICKSNFFDRVIEPLHNLGDFTISLIDSVLDGG